MTDDANDKRAKGLARMREPFPPHQISKLPKATRAQTEAAKSDKSLVIRCALCGQWHHKDAVHLDYVGHAALTDRLLECDPEWNWEPAATTPTGAPFIDKDGMWIKLTVCGVTRFGFGDAQGKTGGDAVKEIIGDALRNAAMRFGAALDLWHKGELHIDDAEPAEQKRTAQQEQQDTQKPVVVNWAAVQGKMLVALRKIGLSVCNDANFQNDLAAMKAEAPELAAQVEAEISTKKQAEAA